MIVWKSNEVACIVFGNGTFDQCVLVLILSSDGAMANNIWREQATQLPSSKLLKPLWLEPGKRGTWALPPPQEFGVCRGRGRLVVVSHQLLRDTTASESAIMCLAPIWKRCQSTLSSIRCQRRIICR